MNAAPLIFVVEDDPDVARLILKALDEFGMRSEWLRSGAALLRRIAAGHPDACILDLGLPDMDGMALIGRLGRCADCGVLVVTGRAHTVDRVMGLEQGADDYVVKPFEPRELVARVRSVLRRRAGGAVAEGARSARFGPWTFHAATHRLVDARGDETTLGTAESSVLLCLLERPNRILTRDQLMGAPDLSPLDRTIDVRISRLRRKLEDDPQNPKLIKTVYGAGYMFCAAVEWS